MLENSIKAYSYYNMMLNIFGVKSASLYNTPWPRIFQATSYMNYDSVLEYSRPHAFEYSRSELMLSESSERQASLLSFRQNTHKRPREPEEKADDDQDLESDDSDRQDVQVEESPEESEHVMIHHI